MTDPVSPGVLTEQSVEVTKRLFAKCKNPSISIRGNSPCLKCDWCEAACWVQNLATVVRNREQRITALEAEKAQLQASSDVVMAEKIRALKDSIALAASLAQLQQEKEQIEEQWIRIAAQNAKDAQQEQDALRAQIEALCEDAVGSADDPLWIVRRELIEKLRAEIGAEEPNKEGPRAASGQ